MAADTLTPVEAQPVVKTPDTSGAVIISPIDKLADRMDAQLSPTIAKIRIGELGQADETGATDGRAGEHATTPGNEPPREGSGETRGELAESNSADAVASSENAGRGGWDGEPEATKEELMGMTPDQLNQEWRRTGSPNIAEEKIRREAGSGEVAVNSGRRPLVPDGGGQAESSDVSVGSLSLAEDDQASMAADEAKRAGQGATDYGNPGAENPAALADATLQEIADRNANSGADQRVEEPARAAESRAGQEITAPPNMPGSIETRPIPDQPVELSEGLRDAVRDARANYDADSPDAVDGPPLIDQVQDPDREIEDFYAAQRAADNALFAEFVTTSTDDLRKAANAGDPRADRALQLRIRAEKASGNLPPLYQNGRDPREREPAPPGGPDLLAGDNPAEAIGQPAAERPGLFDDDWSRMSYDEKSVYYDLSERSRGNGPPLSAAEQAQLAELKAQNLEHYQKMNDFGREQREAANADVPAGERPTIIVPRPGERPTIPLPEGRAGEIGPSTMPGIQRILSIDEGYTVNELRGLDEDTLREEADGKGTRAELARAVLREQEEAARPEPGSPEALDEKAKAFGDELLDKAAKGEEISDAELAKLDELRIDAFMAGDGSLETRRREAMKEVMEGKTESYEKSRNSGLEAERRKIFTLCAELKMIPKSLKEMRGRLRKAQREADNLHGAEPNTPQFDAELDAQGKVIQLQKQVSAMGTKGRRIHSQIRSILGRIRRQSGTSRHPLMEYVGDRMNGLFVEITSNVIDAAGKYMPRSYRTAHA